MPPAPRASKPFIGRTIHQRGSSQTPTTPVKSSPLARSSSPPKATATPRPRPPSRAATPSSRNSIITSGSPGKALPLTDTAPDLNDYVRSSHPFGVDWRSKISHISPIRTTRSRRDLRKWRRHLKGGQINYCKGVSISVLIPVPFAPVLIYFCSGTNDVPCRRLGGHGPRSNER